MENSALSAFSAASFCSKLMNANLWARSISRPVRERCLEPFTGQAVTVSPHACNLLSAQGELVVLALPAIGDGPLNIVVDGQPTDLALIPSGAPVEMDEDWLRVGGLSVRLTGAPIWEPLPDWDGYRKAMVRPPFLDNIPLNPPGLTDVMLTTIEPILAHLAAGWAGNMACLSASAASLAGLGRGLTPAGDDFLTGVMLAAWLTHPNPQLLCDEIVQAAAPRTSLISAAFLRAAARGECPPAWHRLLAALAHGNSDEAATAAQAILAHGATSGADALAGFRWATALPSPGAPDRPSPP